MSTSIEQMTRQVVYNYWLIDFHSMTNDESFYINLALFFNKNQRWTL